MPRKKPRPTLEEHVEIGQAVKDFSRALEKLILLAAPFITKREQQKLTSVDTSLSVFRSDMEDAMFHDFPYLTNDAFVVYYHNDDRADADELMRLAREGGTVDRNAPGGMPRRVWDEMQVERESRDGR